MRSFLRLLRYFLRYRWRVLGGLLSVGFISGADTISAFLVARFLFILEQIGMKVSSGEDVVMEIPIEVFNTLLYTISVKGFEDSFRIIIYFSIITLFLIGFKAIFVYTREYLMSSVQHKLLMNFRTDLFNTVVGLPVGYFDRERTGKIMSRITNDVNNLEQALILMIEIAQNIVYSLVFATALFMVNWQLTIFTILVFTVSGVISRKFGDRIRRFSRDLTNTIAEITSFLQERISSIRTVKSFTREEHEREMFKEKAKKNYFFSMKIVRTIALLSPTNELFNTFVTGMIVVFLGFLFVTGEMNFETMFSFLLLITFLAKPLKALTEGVARVQKSLVSATLIFEILDEPQEEYTQKDSGIKMLTGDIVYERVSFRYHDDTPVLTDVSFTVKEGERVAIVGPSGAGKTTLINLIPRFYEASTGVIRVGGVDSSKLGLRDLRSRIAVVPQEVMLFTGSVSDNIRYGKLTATEAEIYEASKAANAHEFIEQLENGYQTECGERGTQLSGGQRQRIAIARALLRDPKILLLDEATSALDSESEKAVQQALDRLMKGRTTFIIAHRLSTIQKCDRILVLDKGRLVEQGTHVQLLKRRNGLYKKLYRLQMRQESTAK